MQEKVVKVILDVKVRFMGRDAARRAASTRKRRIHADTRNEDVGGWRED